MWALSRPILVHCALNIRCERRAIARVASSDSGTVSTVMRVSIGEIDSIIGMAMRKDAERRYSSAEQLAADLAAGRTSSRKLTEEALARIEDPKGEGKRAFIKVWSKQALAAAAFNDVMGVPAWKALPSWYLVASNDEAIPPDAERQFAARMDAVTIEIPSSHVAMVSHPSDVVSLIQTAAAATLTTTTSTVS